MTKSHVLKASYNLEERIITFGAVIIKLCQKTPKDVITPCRVTQLVEARTTVGANIGEMDDVQGKNDFKLKTEKRKKSLKNQSAVYGYFSWLFLNLKRISRSPGKMPKSHLIINANIYKLNYWELVIGV